MLVYVHVQSPSATFYNAQDADITDLPAAFAINGQRHSNDKARLPLHVVPDAVLCDESDKWLAQLATQQ
jgi:hypothetical protein